NWAVLNGEKETGVTLHYMTTKPDAGDIVCQKRIAISDDDNARTLMSKAAEAAGVMLDEILPKLKAGQAPRIPQDDSKASYFGGRRPEDGEIDWNRSSTEIRNLVRAVTRPYPGAFSFLGMNKVLFWNVAALPTKGEAARPGTIISTDPLVIAAGNGLVEVQSGQSADGVFVGGAQLARELNLVKGLAFGPNVVKQRETTRKRNVLIFGVNGFIGSALSERLLASSHFEVYGMDLWSNNLRGLLDRQGFHFCEGDISIHREWLEYHINKADVVVPLVAIATPIEYTRNPLRVFELDFEENLRIVRYCVRRKKRIVFPSTSEVYGMCDEEEFDEDRSKLVLGPINKQRWIYSCCKQLLD